ncbi:MAG: trypsin-like peptidase domain-containing protein [Candidatus Portnoybacteria bacterium]|nr:trypsin-like peptidase domain-containing protein [Candidatus Portnoybacteria bacterium]
MSFRNHFELKFNPEEAPEPEKKESKDTMEWQFAKELEATPKGQFFAKLQRIAGAFTLAGLLMLPNPKDAIAPERSQESIAIEDMDYSSKYHPEICKKIFEQIKEKGGVAISPQLPEQIYRPGKMADPTRWLALESESPFYNKPEVILGKKFIEESPKEAKKYLEKISQAMKAVVILESRDGLGSGVIIKEGNKKFVLTNAHVCEKQESLNTTFANTQMLTLKVLAKDKKNDVAVLKIPEGIEELFAGTEAMELDKDEISGDDKVVPVPDERLAVIGHPLGFPFAVAITKRLGTIPDHISYRPDERFRNLELYTHKFLIEAAGKNSNQSESAQEGSAPIVTTETYTKDETMPGMSGGAVIKLETDGKARLLGIHRCTFTDQMTGQREFSGGVPVEDIMKLLKDNHLI